MARREAQALQIHIFQQISTEYLLCVHQILILYRSSCPCKTYVLVADGDNCVHIHNITFRSKNVIKKEAAGYRESVINMGSEKILLGK